MSLQSLVVCSDEKIVRVLRRVLSDLEIAVEHCSQTDAALHKLTRQRYETVIVDCSDARGASQILRSARTAPCNKRAIAVAILDEKTGLQNAFAMGAHFVLHKPISMERAKTSFRAARALMKRERRRNVRLPVEIPVTFIYEKGAGQQKTVTVDLSEGGMAVRLSKHPSQGAFRIRFKLPGNQGEIECRGEVAWENGSGAAGVRFVDLPGHSQRQLKAWLNTQLPEGERDDPPVRGKLTDLSLGGCYLETAAPLPLRTRIVLSMRLAEVEVQAVGVVRIMHPELGMGVEFTRNTPEQKQQIEQFIQALMTGSATPELLVEPDGLETEALTDDATSPALRHGEDPLVSLFYNKTALTADAFLGELRRQRQSGPEAREDFLAV